MISSIKQSAAVAAVLAITVSPCVAEKGGGVSPARAKALHECNAKAEKYALYTWGEVQLQVYRACMAEHHQME
jgi:hypothetical protein